MSGVSFRDTLVGSIVGFVEIAGLPWTDISNCLAELAVELSHYTEEGVDLYPRVVVCDNLQNTLKMLQGADSIHIGEGKREPETFRSALKKCAPLARTGWAIYVERHGDGLRFGVFREPTSPIALDLRDTIAGLSEGDAAVIRFCQCPMSRLEIHGVSLEPPRLTPTGSWPCSRPRGGLTTSKSACRQTRTCSLNLQTH